MTPAERLREAARVMRARAEAATPGGPRWETEPDDTLPSRAYIFPADSGSAIASAPVDDAEHIASWHPAVALAVAELLMVCLRLWPMLPPGVRSRALAIADAYLSGGAS